MMSKSKVNPNSYPLAHLIKNLWFYNWGFFRSNEVKMFDFFVLKASAFGHKEFFQSNKTITYETGIHKGELSTIIKKFDRLGIVRVHTKGKGNIQNFSVGFDAIQNMLPKIFRLSEIGEANKKNLLSFFSKLSEIGKANDVRLSEIGESLSETGQPVAQNETTDTINVFIKDNIKDYKKISSKTSPHFFKESEIFNKENFAAALAGTQYEQANINCYHEIINNWSEQSNKKANWLATARSWMLRDMNAGKFVDKNFKAANYENDKRNSSRVSGTNDYSKRF